MTNQEFSDGFDILLNSCASQAQFGDEASRNEITLDEYEKSVLLTQAQDIIVKSFFDKKQNSAGEGFDDSTRRQVDFSSLIKTAELTASPNRESVFDDRGIIYTLPLRRYPVYEGDSSTPTSWTTKPEAKDTDVLFILNEKLNTRFGGQPGYWIHSEGTSQDQSQDNQQIQEGNEYAYPTQGGSKNVPPKRIKNEGGGSEDTGTDTEETYNTVTDAINDGWQWVEDTGMLKSYVVVPINYREYDREMTKAYAQPLKKQAWRLFQNDTQGFDIQSELIPRWDLEKTERIVSYKIRYIRRPCPVVLVNLPDGLEIDGFTKYQECELNPILHPEILQKALEIAIATRGGVNRANQGGREHSNNRENA